MPETAIEIEVLREAGSDGGGFMGWYCKGHHDRYEFHRQICDGYEIDEYDRRWFRPEQAQHVWWRLVPVAGDEPGMMRFVEAEPKSRGAFKATVVDINQMRVERETKELRAWETQGFRKGANFCARWLEDQGHSEAVVGDLITAVRGHLESQ